MQTFLKRGSPLLPSTQTRLFSRNQ